MVGANCMFTALILESNFFVNMLMRTRMYGCNFTSRIELQIAIPASLG